MHFSKHSLHLKNLTQYYNYRFEFFKSFFITTYQVVVLYSFTVFSECDRDVCQNGGTCRQHVLSYFCDCLPGFSGSICESEETVKYISIDNNACYIKMSPDNSTHMHFTTLWSFLNEMCMCCLCLKTILSYHFS